MIMMRRVKGMRMKQVMAPTKKNLKAQDYFIISRVVIGKPLIGRFIRYKLIFNSDPTTFSNFTGDPP